jgi:uncharacterized protein YbbK (DUF523 family)
VSSCLLGDTVRFDGGHKREACLCDELSRLFEFVSVCPEVELGMGVPRAPIRLESVRGEIRLVDPENHIDHTAAITRFASKRVRELEDMELCGYVLKKDSPSCGMQRVQVFPAEGEPRREGQGLFTVELQRRLPDLPIEEEDRLRDTALRQKFIERVLAYARLRTARSGAPPPYPDA